MLGECSVFLRGLPPVFWIPGSYTAWEITLRPGMPA